MKILIIKTSSLGDIIHALPTLQFLRNKYPKAEIDWVVEKPFAEVLKAHPDLNEVLEIETKIWRKNLFSFTTWNSIAQFRRSLRKNRYDLLFDLQGNIKSGLVTSQARAAVKIGFGPKTVAENPNRIFTHLQYDPEPGSNIRSDYLFLAQSYLADFTPLKSFEVCLLLTQQQQALLDRTLQDPLIASAKKLIMVCPGSAWRNKQLSEEALQQFLIKLQSYLSCTFLIIWGSKEEQLLAQRLQGGLEGSSLLVDHLPLPVLQNLMARMQLVIAMDSLPLHLAALSGAATYSIFGASSAAKYRPLGDGHYIYQGLCPYGRTFEKRCPILRTCTTGSCIRSLSADLLFHDFKIQLET